MANTHERLVRFLTASTTATSQALVISIAEKAGYFKLKKGVFCIEPNTLIAQAEHVVMMGIIIWSPYFVGGVLQTPSSAFSSAASPNPYDAFSTTDRLVWWDMVTVYGISPAATSAQGPGCYRIDSLGEKHTRIPVKKGDYVYAIIKSPNSGQDNATVWISIDFDWIF